MKKFLPFVILCMLCSNIVVAKGEIWKCKKTSSKNSKCIKYLNNEPNIEFIGETQNNKPTGYGTIRNQEGTIIGQGVFRMNKDDILKLVDGIIFLYGVDIHLKNNKFYKAKYHSGNIFEGGYLNPDSNKHFSDRNIKGKMRYKNGDSFNGILESVVVSSRIKGTLVFSNGDVWIGNFDKSASGNSIKKGKFIIKNNKSIDFVEGEFKGDYFYGTLKYIDDDDKIKFDGKILRNLSRLVEGKLYLRDGSKYIGTFKNNGEANNGEHHYSNGVVKKVKNGKFSKSINVINYLNLYNILGLVIIGSFLLHLNANKQLYSGKKKFNLIEAIKSFMDTPLGGAILLLILAIILFKVFNAAVSTDLGRPRFFGHDGG